MDGVARDIRELVLAKKRVLVMAGSRGGVFLAGKGRLGDPNPSHSLVIP